MPYAPKEYNSFERNEHEGMVTLLNISHHVLSNPPRGYAIAYDAKQYYRKTEKLVSDFFEKSISLMGRSIFVDKSDVENTKTVYLLQDYDLLEQVPIEQVFKNVCLRLREQWKDATAYNSMRWYLETQWPNMVFVPLYKGLPVFGGFQMPLYKILDVDEEQIASSLFPAEIPIEIYDELGVKFSKIDQWLKAAGYVGKLRLLITQYNDVVNKISNESGICEQGVIIYLQTLINYIDDTITKINNFMEPGIEILSNVRDDNAKELCIIIITAFNNMENILEAMNSLELLSELPEQLKNAIVSMILLSPYMFE